MTRTMGVGQGEERVVFRRNLLVLVVLIFATGCLPTFQYSIDRVSKRVSIPGILGGWHTEFEKDDKVQIKIVKLKSGWHEIKDVGRQSKDDKIFFVAHKIGSHRYLTFVEGESFSVAKSQGYYLGQIKSLTKDNLDIAILDSGGLKTLVQNGQLKGHLKPGLFSGIQITEAPRALKNKLKSGLFDSLFTKVLKFSRIP